MWQMRQMPLVSPAVAAAESKGNKIVYVKLWQQCQLTKHNVNGGSIAPPLVGNADIFLYCRGLAAQPTQREPH
jgi:hypothetical protein